MSNTEPVEVPEEAGPLDCSRPEVVTKYRTAADIANEVLQAVVDACQPGADIASLCKMGDELIEAKCEKVYTKKEKGEKIRKGVAFPTCITPNELCANYSPLVSESRVLNKGDLVKVDVGCHIDGFIAVGAHSLVVGAEKEEITGRKADALRAAWAVAEVAQRTIAVGASNTDVTRLMNKAAEQFSCKMVHGIQSHQMKQHVIDGVRAIRSRENMEEKAERFTFAPNEVYGVDIVVSTGEGKPKESDCRTCVFKRNVEQTYSLKTPLARQFLRETTARFPSLPFTARAIEDEKLCRVGISECTRHGLLQAYPVMTERQGEHVAQFKFTLMLLPGGGKKVTGLPLFQDEQIKSESQVHDEELKALLATSVNPKKKKKKARQELKEAVNAGSTPEPSA